MLPKSNSLNSIKDADSDKIPGPHSSRLQGSSSFADPNDMGRPTTPEPHVETEKEREARRERRRLRRAKKEAEEAASQSPRREVNPETPEKERLKAPLARSSSVRVAPAKPLPPLPEGATKYRSSTGPHPLLVSPKPASRAPPAPDSDDESSEGSALSIGIEKEAMRSTSQLALKLPQTPERGRTVEPTSARLADSQGGEITVKYQPKKEEIKNFISEEGSEPADLKRMKVLNEILNTERDYVRDLVTIRELFLMPIRDNKCLSEVLVGTVFSNVTTLLNVNKTLLKEFSDTAAKDKGDSIGICFIHLADYLKMYSIYCNNQDLALQTCRQQMKDNEKFRTFVQQQQASPACKRNDLQSFLIKPVQRLCKYPLLLRELIKCTPIDHPDRKRLDEAFLRLEGVVLAVEEGRKKVDTARQIQEIKIKMLGAEKLDLVTPTRLFLKEGTLHCINEIGVMKELHLVLFNDVLLVSRVTSSIPRMKSHDANRPYLFRHIVARNLLIITSLEVAEVENNQHVTLKHRFRLEYAVSGKIYKRTFAFSMHEMKADWLNELQRHGSGDATPRGKTI